MRIVVRPTAGLQALLARRTVLARSIGLSAGHTSLTCTELAVGVQGQAPVATKLIDDGVREGHWVFLANCHLMTSWLPALDKIIEGLPNRKPHPDFRLWLSSNPSPAFPIAILQRGVKLTTEPPKGLRANLLRLYNTVDDASYGECKAAGKYQKLLFTLAYFHSVLLERRKFRTLGLNIPYDFNDTDFKVSDDLLKSYLDAYKDTPWDALRCAPPLPPAGRTRTGSRGTASIFRAVFLCTAVWKRSSAFWHYMNGLLPVRTRGLLPCLIKALSGCEFELMSRRLRSGVCYDRAYCAQDLQNVHGLVWHVVEHGAHTCRMLQKSA